MRQICCNRSSGYEIICEWTHIEIFQKVCDADDIQRLQIA